MSMHRYCDGVKRRDFLKVGALGGLGLNLVDYLRLAQAGQVTKPKASAAIYIRLGGGPTHMDTFDMKPEAPEEYRGQLKPIKTNVPGIEISEKLPHLAKVADKYTILRGVSQTLAAHELGTKYMLTGNRPLPSLEYPAMGSVVSKELSSPRWQPKILGISGVTDPYQPIERRLRITRRCLRPSTLAAAPPKRALLRRRTSTNTSTAPS